MIARSVDVTIGGHVCTIAGVRIAIGWRRIDCISAVAVVVAVAVVFVVIDVLNVIDDGRRRTDLRQRNGRNGRHRGGRTDGTGAHIVYGDFGDFRSCVRHGNLLDWRRTALQRRSRRSRRESTAGTRQRSNLWHCSGCWTATYNVVVVVVATSVVAIDDDDVLQKKNGKHLLLIAVSLLVYLRAIGMNDSFV